MKAPKIPKEIHEEDFDTMLDIGTALQREAKRKALAEQQEALRHQQEEEDTDAEE